MDAKVVWIALDKDDPEDKTRWVKLGVRIVRPNQDSWFYAYRFQTWTRTLPGVQLYYRSGSPQLDRRGKPLLTEEKKLGPYKGDEGLKKAYGHCQGLLGLLFHARELAEEADEARRMG